MLASQAKLLIAMISTVVIGTVIRIHVDRVRSLEVKLEIVSNDIYDLKKRVDSKHSVNSEFTEETRPTWLMGSTLSEFIDIRKVHCIGKKKGTCFSPPKVLGIEGDLE